MSEFFRLNETIVVFAHGLVFFSLGFAVWLHRRRATRLTLTSSLIWLAGFAFLEALAIWGYHFIPLQNKYMSEGVIDGLIALRTLMQVLAYLFLLQFGLRLVNVTARRWTVLTAASVTLAVGLVAVSTVAAGPYGWGIEDWADSVVASCRYALLLPGALLAAWGLWQHRGELGTAGMVRIQPYAAAAAGVLVFYAVVGGLVVDSATWAPPGMGNHDGWMDIVGVPMAAIRGVAGLALCVFAVKLLEIFEVEDKQRLDAVDRRRAVAEERARFGRDLHDGTIQTLYAAGLHLEALSLRLEDAEARREVSQIVGSLNGATDDIREYIQCLRQGPSTAAEVVDALHVLTVQFANETRVPTRFRAEGVASAGPLPDEVLPHLTQILREALANAARHAGPCRVEVTLSFSPDELDLIVTDDGVGLNGGHRPDGHGLRNMKERARRLGGRLEAGTRSGRGTRVALALPLDAEMPETDEPTPRTLLQEAL